MRFPAISLGAAVVLAACPILIDAQDIRAMQVAQNVEATPGLIPALNMAMTMGNTLRLEAIMQTADPATKANAAKQMAAYVAVSANQNRSNAALIAAVALSSGVLASNDPNTADAWALVSSDPAAMALFVKLNPDLARSALASTAIGVSPFTGLRDVTLFPAITLPSPQQIIRGSSN